MMTKKNLETTYLFNLHRNSEVEKHEVNIHENS